MFKIRMQGQFGGAGDKKLGKVVGDVWRNYGLRDGIMRGYWVSASLTTWYIVADVKATFAREIPAYAGFYTGEYCQLRLS
jgi:solute carrier family 25 carnitine/acylcarnitine transporter 20/29